MRACRRQPGRCGWGASLFEGMPSGWHGAAVDVQAACRMLMQVAVLERVGGTLVPACGYRHTAPVAATHPPFLPEQMTACPAPAQGTRPDSVFMAKPVDGRRTRMCHGTSGATATPSGGWRTRMRQEKRQDSRFYGEAA